MCNVNEECKFNLEFYYYFIKSKEIFLALIILLNAQNIMV